MSTAGITTTQAPRVAKKAVDTVTDARLPLKPSDGYSRLEKLLHNYKTATGRETAVITEMFDLIGNLERRIAQLEAR